MKTGKELTISYNCATLANWLQSFCELLLSSMKLDVGVEFGDR